MLAVVPLRVQQPPRWVARYRPFGVVEQGVTRPVAFLQTVASPGRAFNAAHPAVRASRVEDLGDLYAESGQTLQGSFSAAADVSKPNFSSKYSLESSRRDLHNARLCTVLQYQIFH